MRWEEGEAARAGQHALPAVNHPARGRPREPLPRPARGSAGLGPGAGSLGLPGLGDGLRAASTAGRAGTAALPTGNAALCLL